MVIDLITGQGLPIRGLLTPVKNSLMRFIFGHSVTKVTQYHKWPGQYFAFQVNVIAKCSYLVTKGAP